MNSFTFFEDYYDLITLLDSREEQGELILAILEFMFDEKEPTLNDRQMKIFKNLKRPLVISKNKSKSKKNKIKSKSNENQMKIKLKSNKDETNEVVTKSMSMSISKSISNNKKDNRVIGEEEKEEVEILDNNSIAYHEIISYLNQVVGTSYRPTSKETQKHIKARLNDGFTIDDFKQVIDNMAFKWLKDEKMNRYLRPETLFGTKFESYLNETPIVKPKTLKDISYADIDAMIEYEEKIENEEN